MKTKNFLFILPIALLFFSFTNAQNLPTGFPPMPDFPEFEINIPNPNTGTSSFPDINEMPNFPGIPQMATSARVTILKFVDGSPATASSTGNAIFAMNATYNSSNTGQGSGTYALGPAGYNGNLVAYQAVTVPLNKGASYMTNEILNSTTGSSCATSTGSTTPFALVGYTVGNSVSEALSANISTVSPNLQNIQNDKYIIVWNDDCATVTTGGNTGGNNSNPFGVLKMDGIETLSQNGIANDTFENGFKYVFNVTMPTQETLFTMRFADWVNSGNNTILLPVAGNIRISSMQASSSVPVILNTANIYATSTLQIVGDLEPDMPGKQVKILVEVKIPSQVQNGAYTTTYGIRTQ